jgi:protein TonB
MLEPTTKILLDRNHDAGGLAGMFTASMTLHVLIVATLILLPTGWGVPTDADKVVMTISLGGAPGPQAGGMTPMGGRPVQEAVPTPEKPTPQPVRPPAAKPPEMTVPTAASRPAPPPKPAPQVKSAPDEARGRTPTQGAQVQSGSAIADTGGRGMGFGLSTGGGGTGGYLDVANFCCPEYLGTMMQLIQRNWNSKQEVAGEAVVKATIQRDGRLTGIEVERSSGYTALDLTAQRALMLTRQIPPLPPAFTEDHLTVHFIFQYQR